MRIWWSVAIGLAVCAAGPALASASAIQPPRVALSATEIALGILKFAGLVIGTGSAIWGLTQKLTADHADGGRTLTPQGRISLALALGSFLIAGAAASVDLVAANLKKQNQILADAAAAAAAAERDRKADEKDRKAAESAARTQIMLFEAGALARLNENRRSDDVTAARFLELETAAIEERRDARLALSVSRGTSANLARTQAALGELERVLQPLGTPVVQMSWEVRATTPEAALMLQYLASLAKRLRAGEPAVVAGLDFGDLTPPYAQKLKSFILTSKSPFYPSFGNLLRDVVSATPRAAIFAPKNAQSGLDAARATPGYSPGGPLFRKGDIRFDLAAHAPSMIYHIDQELLIFETVWKPNDWIDLTGDVVSIPDLEKSVLVVDPGAPSSRAGPRRELRRLVQPSSLIISANGRRWVLKGERFRRVQTKDGYALFVVDELGKPGFQFG